MQFLGKALLTAGVLACGIAAVGAVKKPSSIYKNCKESQNPLEGKRVVFVPSEDDKPNADGVCGHLEAIGLADSKTSLYDKVFKRAIDASVSLCGLIVLSPVLLGLSAAIYVDDPGPVLFTQKRLGRNKQYFKLHKFRSMKMCTPHDVPTHMLENPEQYITRAGKFIRSHSLDELPQVWDIFIGNMSIIGPRPALWNQDMLTALRDEQGANDIRPGLTGWAQINGRDELELGEKARLDGEYCRILKQGGWKAFAFDCRCFWRTIFSVAKAEGVVEGGTGEMNKSAEVSSERN